MKKHGHIFVRYSADGKSMILFCRNCDDTRTLPLPMIVEDVASDCLAFDRAHNNCPEPHPGQQTYPVGTAPK